MLFGSIISCFFPLFSSYILTLILSGYHSSILPVLSFNISYDFVIFGSNVVSVGTIATTPSSNNDSMISCLNDLPVWSRFASKFKHLFKPLFIISLYLPSSSVLTWKISMLAASKANLLYIEAIIVLSLPFEYFLRSGL